jgi:probable rRNA maturation factor
MSPSDDLVLFHRAPAGLRRGPVREFARTLRDGVGRRRDFHFLITDDRELRRLNKRFRGADYATDVLSFPSADPKSRWLGEIAISADRAAQQAREFGHSRLDEIRILMLHGVLHLLGMDHETDQGAMGRAEARWRKKLDLPAGLIARTP